MPRPAREGTTTSPPLSLSFSHPQCIAPRARDRALPISPAAATARAGNSAAARASRFQGLRFSTLVIKPMMSTVRPQNSAAATASRIQGLRLSTLLISPIMLTVRPGNSAATPASARALAPAAAVASAARRGASAAKPRWISARRASTSAASLRAAGRRCLLRDTRPQVWVTAWHGMRSSARGGRHWRRQVRRAGRQAMQDHLRRASASAARPRFWESSAKRVGTAGPGVLYAMGQREEGGVAPQRASLPPALSVLSVTQDPALAKQAWKTVVDITEKAWPPSM